MPDRVKTSVSSKRPSKEDLERHVELLTEMCLKHRDAWNRFVDDNEAQAFKIGMVFSSTVATDPSVLLGYGTWTAFGAGRALVGLDAGDTDFDTVEQTGGAKTHTLVEAEMPSHTHVQDAHSHTYSVSQTDDTTVPLDRADAGTSGTPSDATTPTNTTVATNQDTGGDAAHNNLQPYIVVYFWKRVS